MRRWPAVLFGVSIAVASPLAFAQPPADANQQSAQELFNVALALFEKGSYEGALKAFEDVNKKFPSVGALYKIGECNEKLGKPVAAWAAFKAAADTAHTKADTQREQAAREKASSLEPKLPKLVVTHSVDGLEVRINGEVVKPERWNKPLLQGPGQKDLVVSAPGYATSTTRVNVSDDGRSGDIAVPALEKAPDPGKGQKTIGLIVGGVGVAGLAVGAITGLMASSAKDERDKLLSSNGCSKPSGSESQVCPSTLAQNVQNEINDKQSSAQTLSTVSTIGFIAGGALVVGGAVLFFTAPKAAGKEAGPPPPATGKAKPIQLTDVALAPATGPTNVGLSLSGRW
jgi:hypothetical protein